MISTSTWESCYKYVSIACNIKIFCHCYHIFRPKIGIFVQKPFSNPHEQFLWLFKLPVDALSPNLLAVCHSLSGWFLWVAKYGTGQIKESIICQGMPLNWIYLFYECKICQEIIITTIQFIPRPPTLSHPTRRTVYHYPFFHWNAILVLYLTKEAEILVNCKVKNGRSILNCGQNDW